PVDAAGVQPHGVGPRPGRGLRRHEEVAATVGVLLVHKRAHDPERPAVVTDRRRVQPTGRGDAVEVELAGPVDDVADLLPGDEVTAVEDRQAGEVLEGRGHQVVVVPDPAHGRVRVAARQDRVTHRRHRTPASLAAVGTVMATATCRGSAAVTSWSAPVIRRVARAVADPGSVRRTARRPLVIAPPVSWPMSRSRPEAPAWEATHTSTSPGSTTRT